jgi:rfaE bifunctional protein nucleotidyltransferase chain/domain
VGALITIAEAHSIRARLRRQKQIVVFTNGVFDLLHVGHVRYLQAARRLGDVLFVGLNSDASTRALKGPARPLIEQAERAEVLCALSCVDWVIIFDEPTAESVVENLQPDVYAKGGDYADGKPLPEAPLMVRSGGRVVILPYTSGHSTTCILNRILDLPHGQQGG